jgi:hypothetical protein
MSLFKIQSNKFYTRKIRSKSQMNQKKDDLSHKIHEYNIFNTNNPLFLVERKRSLTLL